MESITTFKQLHHNLSMGPGYEGYIQLVKAIELPVSEYKALCHWNSEKYQRIRFYDTDSLEGLLTCWQPGQASKIHNFHDNVGWLKVLEGELELQHFKTDQNDDQPVYTKTYQAGEVGFLNDDLGFHRFVNTGQQNAVALFFYSDKIKEWDVLELQSRKVRTEKVGCDYNLDETTA